MAKVQQWGGSLGVRIPQKAAQRIGIVHGSEMTLTVDDNGIRLEPVKQKPTLDTLLSQVTPDNQHKEVDFGHPEGDELI